MKLQGLLLLLSINVALSQVPWVNDFNKPFNYECPSGQSIKRWHTEYSNQAKDRRFAFECKTTPGLSTCQWSDYANNYDGILDFQCSGNAVVSGVGSVFHGYYGDRRYKFYCCTTSATLQNCGLSNVWRAPFARAFTNPFAPNQYNTGAYSIHSNTYEDRRFKFYTCRI